MSLSLSQPTSLSLYFLFPVQLRRGSDTVALVVTYQPQSFTRSFLAFTLDHIPSRETSSSHHNASQVRRAVVSELHSLLAQRFTEHLPSLSRPWSVASLMLDLPTPSLTMLVHTDTWDQALPMITEKIFSSICLSNGPTVSLNFSVIDIYIVEE